jgi:hypothetical protein
MHILRLVAFAVVLSTMPGFALAMQSGASQTAVVLACKHAGCAIYRCGGGCIWGCGTYVCFRCRNGWCVQTDRTGKPIRGGSLSGILKNAPPGAASSNAGNKPVNETPTRNTEPITERVGGKH